jgi:TfoX/Sxy family transcriptional regulator of competence genes
MATQQSTVDYIVDQLARFHDIATRKMFGEYAVYCNEKIVALICDEQLFVKPTVSGKALIGSVQESPPYPGAKPYFLITGDECEDREFLCSLIMATAKELPEPKKKKKK